MEWSWEELVLVHWKCNLPASTGPEQLNTFWSSIAFVLLNQTFLETFIQLKNNKIKVKEIKNCKIIWVKIWSMKPWNWIYMLLSQACSSPPSARDWICMTLGINKISSRGIKKGTVRTQPIKYYLQLLCHIFKQESTKPIPSTSSLLM